ncbi:MAG: acyloxyacyl hydrolase [Candidatus Omnitrophica bacterium]|nr:acyloxyacyl hydrolase [Candidatus Omnitrophota bacterium]
MKKLFKTLMFTSLSALILTCAVIADDSPESTSPFRPDEISLRYGYNFAELSPVNKNTDLKMDLILVDLGYKMNDLLHLGDHKGTIQFVVEPFFTFFRDPEQTYGGGLVFLFNYSYPVTQRWALYGELGAGPMYFGAETYEQEKVGFNFFDQGGGGVRFKVDDNKILSLGYRRTHVSDLDLRDLRNGGITGDMILGGITLLY